MKISYRNTGLNFVDSQSYSLLYLVVCIICTISEIDGEGGAMTRAGALRYKGNTHQFTHAAIQHP